MSIIHSKILHFDLESSPKALLSCISGCNTSIGTHRIHYNFIFGNFVEKPYLCTTQLHKCPCSLMDKMEDSGSFDKGSIPFGGTASAL